MFIGGLRLKHLAVVLLILMIAVLLLMIMIPSLQFENSKAFYNGKYYLLGINDAKRKSLNLSNNVNVSYSTWEVKDQYLGSSLCNTTLIEDIEGIANLVEEPKNRTIIHNKTEISASYYGSRVSTNWNFNKNSFLQLRRNVTKYFNSTSNVAIFKQPTHPRDMRFPQVCKNCVPKEIVNYIEHLPLQRRCAVVGSSGILRESQCGEEIDAHDFVLRSNYPMLQNFSEDVGSKANLTAVNVLTHLKIFPGLFGKKAKNFSKLKGEALAPYLYLKHINDSVLWYHHDNKRFLEKLPDYMANARRAGLTFRIAYSVSPNLHNQTVELWGLEDPSTGMLLLAEAILICDYISVYGYYPFHTDQQGSPISHHYWKNVRFNYERQNHQNWNKEFQTLLELHRNGALKLVAGKCS